MVFRDDKGGAVFFQDARRRYEFFCGEKGLLLLSGLLARTALVLKKNEEELKKLGPKAAAIVEEGRRIYGEKPSLRKFGSEAEGKNVTWSDGEYAHVGLQTQYLKLKSLHYTVRSLRPRRGRCPTVCRDVSNRERRRVDGAATRADRGATHSQRRQRFTETYNLCARACDADAGVQQLFARRND